jgi:hypothetical protein
MSRKGIVFYPDEKSASFRRLFAYTLLMRRTNIFQPVQLLYEKCPSCEKLIRPSDIARLTFDYSRCPHCGTAYATVDIWGKE